MKRALFLTLLMAGGSIGHTATGDSPEASWPVLAGCVEAPPLAPDAEPDFRLLVERMQRCAEAAQTVVRDGTDSDRERLWSFFDDLPEQTEMDVAADVLNAFLDWHVERALADLESSSPPAGRELALAADLELPAFLAHATAELQVAWRTYQTVTRDDREGEAPRHGEDTVSFQANQRAFEGTIAGFLRGHVSAAETVRDLSRYQWSGWCGTGSEALYGPQSKALLIAHLDARRPDLALAASGGIGGPMPATAEKPVRWDRRLLAAAGIDWERFYLGGVLSGEADLANELARHGSDRAARQLLATARLAAAMAGAPTTHRNPEDEDAGSDWDLGPESLLWPVAALVEPSGECGEYGTSDSRDFQRDPQAAIIDGGIQQEVLDLLAANVGADAGLSEAEAAAHLLVRLCRPESRLAFHVMLRSPYEGVRKKAAVALRALREPFAEPRPSRPVAFKVVVDGTPTQLRKLQWSLETEEGQQVTSEAATDADGVVRLERDPFVDARHPVTSVRLAAPDLASADGVWFEAGLDAPARLDAVNAVSVRTGRLVVIVPRPLMKGADGSPPTLVLLAIVTRYGSDEFPLMISEELPVPSARVAFPRLQRGRYQALVHQDGTLYASAPVEVGDSGATAIVSERSMADERADQGPPFPDE